MSETARLLEVASLRAEVARLSELQKASEAARTREVSLLEMRIEELKESNAKQVASLTAELEARRGEAAEMRLAVERQQQREAALRWQAATLKGERDQAFEELKTWNSAGWLRRLLGHPRILTTSNSGAEDSPALLEVRSED